jgi:hypothetical protein
MRTAAPSHTGLALLDESAAPSVAAPRPQRAQPRATTQRAHTLRFAGGSGHIGNLQSAVLLAVLPALRPGGTNPRREHCPVPDSGWRCARVRTSSAPLRWPTQPKRTHGHAAPRRALSLTIASQTIASSPDGSESSSAASSACGTPAATVGGGGFRFRASSTVTSSSSPCNKTLAQPVIIHPPNLVGRSAGAPPGAAAGWPRLPRPATPNWTAKLQSPAKRLPPRAPAFGTAACSTSGCTRRRQGACTLGYMRLRLPCDDYGKSVRARVTAGRAVPRGCRWAVSLHLGGHGGRQRLRRQNRVG